MPLELELAAVAAFNRPSAHQPRTSVILPSTPENGMAASGHDAPVSVIREVWQGPLKRTVPYALRLAGLDAKLTSGHSALRTFAARQ